MEYLRHRLSLYYDHQNDELKQKETEIFSRTEDKQLWDIH